jgi:hypothetical protein
MRVLIFTHGRSGGKSLLDWISQEKRFYVYHEPYLKDEQILRGVMNDDNIVVKTFPSYLSQYEIDTEEFCRSFDKVICHVRENRLDVAISTARGLELSDKQDFNWHHTYKVDYTWILENESKIDDVLDHFSPIYEAIVNLKVDCLRTTYDGVFENKNDISKLLDYLEIKKPIHLDRLDNRHRLRNGDIGHTGYTVNKSII